MVAKLYQAKTYNILYTLILSFLLLLSFNPTESAGSNLALYMRLVPFVIFLLLIILNNLTVRVSLRKLSFVFFICVFILLIKFNSISARFLFQLVPIVLSFFVVNILNKNNEEREVFKNVLTVLIVVWVTLLIIQLVAFYLFGLVVDIHNMVFKASEARGFINQDILRFGGLQIEPGTYSNWLFGVVFLRAILIRKISAPLHWVAVLSMLLTLSFWAYVAFAFFLMAALFESKNILRAWTLVAVTVACFAVYIYIGNDYASYLLTRASLDSATATGKMHVYSYVINNLEEWLIFGASLGLQPCDICYSPQDAGVGINLLYYFGFFMFFIFALFLMKTISIFGVKGVFLVTPIFLAKYYYWDPITIMILMFVLFYSYGVKLPKCINYLTSASNQTEGKVV